LETLVLIGIFIVLLSIFIPYISSIRESNRRIACRDNLQRIMVALQSYARDNAGAFPRVMYDPQTKPDGYSAFTGADDANPFAATSEVKLNDVTASLWLLVRGKYVIDPRIFVCPSSDGSRDLMTDASGSPMASPAQRGNFRRADNLTYSYASPFSSAPNYRLNDTKPSGFVLMADKNPGDPAATVGPNASPLELARANSPNHAGVGQNVVYSQGNVEFRKTPYCGVGEDNIYTARAVSYQLTTQPTTLPNNVIGVFGMNFSPVRNDDTYLVPTATDLPMPGVSPRPATAPTTSAPATTSSTTATSAPATQAHVTTVPASSPATTQ
jgi:type II secretory pathway pseudopilin PulG